MSKTVEPPKHPCLTNWRSRCNRVIEHGTKFTDQEVLEAGMWDACACGEAKKKYKIPYVVSPHAWIENLMVPADPTLKRLGKDFAVYVEGQKPQKALKVIDKIENRLKVKSVYKVEGEEND